MRLEFSILWAGGKRGLRVVTLTATACFSGYEQGMRTTDSDDQG